MDNLRYLTDTQLHEHLAKLDKYLSIEATKIVPNWQIVEQLRYYKQSILDEISQRQYNTNRDKELKNGSKNLTNDQLAQREDINNGPKNPNNRPKW